DRPHEFPEFCRDYGAGLAGAVKKRFLYLFPWKKSPRVSFRETESYRRMHDKNNSSNISCQLRQLSSDKPKTPL
ncbi:MAG: hypothetical protein KKD99_09810, partial [Proteobacteria bacterium]|nr:hypothetical protein [Pseudomonadota bacterium]